MPEHTNATLASRRHPRSDPPLPRHLSLHPRQRFRPPLRPRIHHRGVQISLVVPVNLIKPTKEVVLGLLDVLLVSLCGGAFGVLLLEDDLLEVADAGCQAGVLGSESLRLVLKGLVGFGDDLECLAGIVRRNCDLVCSDLTELANSSHRR